MIATISMLDHRFSQGQNTAGAPLPLIPRRTSSSTAPRPVLAPSPSLPLPTRSSYPLASCSTTVTPPTPPKNESDSSTRRVRGRPSLCPPELSTPVPTSQHVFPTKSGHGSASQPMLYTPGISLRLGGLTSVPKQRGVSESHVPPVPVPTTPSDDTRLIRKKCGQLVKSSLKSSRSSSRVGASVSTGGLSVFTMHQASKSEPTTPTSKAVHFDSKLEHVKLFLSEQKPLAVSRDGSPTDDTSGTDSDFPRFIFGASASAPPSAADASTKLIMHLTNLPALPTLQSDSRLVALESLTLAPDASAIHGSVRVRNLAYSKAVRARFTFDNWMTTSEVCARWVESVPASLAPTTPSSARLPMHWDRFAFTIKLNDLGAVEKERSRTLMLAVKYVVEGREAEAMWDNNAGCNYRATFSRVQVQPQVQPPRRLAGRARLGSDEAEVEDEEETETEGKGQREARDMADLRSKLEKVVADASSSSTAALTNTAPSQAAAAATSFAARYDFAASYKTAWNPDAGLLAHANRSPARGVRAVAMHHRAQSFPLSSDAAKNVGGHHHHHQRYAGYAAAQQQQQSRTLGSPRDLGDDNEFHLPRRGQDESGYFDLPVGAGGSGTPPRYNSFPPSSSSSSSSASSSSTATVVQSNALKGVGLGLGAALVQTDSALSTPGMVSPASTSSSSSSEEDDDNEHAVADDDDDEGFAALVEGDLMGEGGLEGAGMVGVQRRGGRGGGWEMANGAMAVNPDTPYRQFLNKFCFFTGPGSGTSPLNTGVALARTSAAAGLEDLLAAGLRSSESVASVEMGGSGSVTPTMGGVGVVASS